jgi:hypothetical protein
MRCLHLVTRLCCLQHAHYLRWQQAVVMLLRKVGRLKHISGPIGIGSQGITSVAAALRCKASSAAFKAPANPTCCKMGSKNFKSLHHATYAHSHPSMLVIH